LHIDHSGAVCERASYNGDFDGTGEAAVRLSPVEASVLQKPQSPVLDSAGLARVNAKVVTSDRLRERVRLHEY